MQKKKKNYNTEADSNPQSQELELKCLAKLAIT